MQSLGQTFIILFYQNELGPDGSTSISLPETRLKALAFPFAFLPLQTAELQTCTQINLLHTDQSSAQQRAEAFSPKASFSPCYMFLFVHKNRENKRLWQGKSGKLKQENSLFPQSLRFSLSDATDSTQNNFACNQNRSGLKAS